MHFVLNGVVSIFIGSAVSVATFDSPARHPHAESVWVMIAAVALRGWSTSEFAAPEDECVIEESALLQVG